MPAVPLDIVICIATFGVLLGILIGLCLASAGRLPTMPRKGG